MRWPMLLGLLFAVASALEQMRQFPEAFSPPMLLWLSSLYTMAVTYIWFEEEHVFSRSVQSEAYDASPLRALLQYNARNDPV